MAAARRVIDSDGSETIRIERGPIDWARALIFLGLVGWVLSKYDSRLERCEDEAPAMRAQMKAVEDEMRGLRIEVRKCLDRHDKQHAASMARE